MVSPEVSIDNGLVAHHSIWASFGDDFALSHDDDPIADVTDHIHVMLDEENGHTFITKVFDMTQ